MANWKDDRLESAVQGRNPTVLLRMKSGFAVIGDTQFLPGYCLLLAYPKVGSLNDLSLEQRADFLLDMSLLGDAIHAVCKPLRVNYEILGNTDPFLHAHISPRYAWEEESRRKSPVWLYPQRNWALDEYQFRPEKHGDLKERLTSALQDAMNATATIRSS
ncbi:MAG: HIT family protein [Bacillota bacterium]